MGSREENYWVTRFGKVSRRRFVSGAGATGLGLGMLGVVGCGDDDSTAGSPTARASASAVATVAAAIKRGGKLTAGLDADVTTFDAHTGIAGSDANYTYLVFDPLVGYDSSVKPNANLSLAQSWEQPDDTTITFHLRDASFTDGTPVDAQAIAWNLNRILDPAAKAVNRGELAPISSVQTPDAHTVTLKLSTIAADLLITLGSRSSLIISPTAYQKLGQQFASAPVGSGPFTVQSRTIGDRVVFAKNPSYWRKDAAGGALPYLDNIEVRFIQDTTARVEALLAGDVQLDSQVDAKDSSRVKSSSDLQTVTLDGYQIASSLAANYALPPLDDVNLRLATQYALNPQDIVTGVYLGEATLAKGGYWPPTLWVYQDIPDRPMYDLAKAKQLLAASKYNGEVLSLSTWNRADVTQATTVIQQQLQAAGIKTEITNGDVGSVSSRFYNQKAFHFFSSAFGLYPAPDHIASNVYSSKGSQNAGAISGAGQDAQIDALVVKGRSTYDLNQRKTTYTDLTKRGFALGEPLDTLVYGRSIRSAAKKVGNFNQVALQGDSWFRFAEAYLT
jgi:peptide/nickel transport system substrate-binding protein